MSTTTYECVHCGRDTFTSQRGLTQHQQRNHVCANKFRMADIRNSGYHTANEGMLYTEINLTSSRRSETINELPKLLSQLQRKLPSKRRFNSGVDDQMFDHSGKHWPKFALNRLLFWQINCRQGPICRTPEPCMGYLLSSVYLFLHAEVLWCVSVRFLNDTSTFICEKITFF